MARKSRRWRVAWRFQIFLMATDLFLFTQMLFMLTLGSTKKSCIAQKTVVSTKKSMFHIEINVAQQNYVSRKKICCGNKKYYVTPRKRLMLTKYV